MAGQTAEDIRDNIVKIVDENGNCVGTGFFIHKEYCVTCHHSIWQLKEISVEREADPEKGREKRPYHAEWVEEFSDVQKDVAFLKVKGADFRPLQYRRETYGNIPVVVTGFPSQDLYNFPDGKEERGTLTNISRRFRWEKQEIIVADEGEDRKKKKWNMKPEVDVPAFAFDGKFHVGFSGAPVCYEHDWKVVGMFEAKDDNQGYMIPMNIVVEKFDLEKKRKLSGPSPTLPTEKIIDMGINYSNKGEYAKAIEQYEIILNDPNYIKALNNKGGALASQQKYKEAIKCYDKAIEIKPELPTVWYNKGVVLYNLGRHKEAIKCYDKAVEINPNDGYVWYNKGVSLSILGRHKEAIKCYDKAVEINPNDASAWGNKGLALASQQKYKEAIKCYDKAVEINPNDANFWGNKGSMLNALGGYEESIAYYDKAVEINPNDASAWSNKGTALHSQQKYKEAIKCYDKAIKLKSDYASAWYNRALAKVKKGDTENGLEDLKRAIEIDKDNIEGAKKAKDFESIRNDKRFKALVMKRKTTHGRRKNRYHQGLL